jgi:hypothetical protein
MSSIIPAPTIDTPPFNPITPDEYDDEDDE